MTAIRLIQKPVDGKIVIDVPEEMRDLTLEIDVRPADSKQRSAVMNTRKGRLQNRTYPVDKYDVYNQ